MNSRLVLALLSIGKGHTTALMFSSCHGSAVACDLDSLGKIHWALDPRRWWRPERLVWWSEPESPGNTTAILRWAWFCFLWINATEFVQKQTQIPPVYIHLKYIQFHITATVDSMLKWVSTNVYFFQMPMKPPQTFLFLLMDPGNWGGWILALVLWRRGR